MFGHADYRFVTLSEGRPEGTAVHNTREIMLCFVNKGVLGKMNSWTNPPPPQPLNPQQRNNHRKQDDKSFKRISKLSRWNLEFSLTSSRLASNLMFANEDVFFFPTTRNTE